MIGKGAVRSVSVIPYLGYAKCFRDCWFGISFVHVPAKVWECHSVLRLC